ncbi:hypothetical protein Taro_008475 [Colocasia esculenta]|uniref:Uncharacterized protein n=1 Tax=Colocasia esculenta TaxID=4460 RepID=A0A843U736_COLES|nr:hypothetical protein [Colocasia esculenta]
MLVSRNSVLGPKLHCRAYVLVHRFSYPLGQTRIFVRIVIATAREVPIRNRHFDPVGTRSDLEISGPVPKFISGSVVAGYDAIAYGHPLAQTGITFSSFIGIAYKAPIRNRNSEALVTPYCLSNVSLDHVNPWRGNHTESSGHSDRKLCSTPRENSSPGCRYGCTNITDIVTPSKLFPPLQ